MINDTLKRKRARETATDRQRQISENNTRKRGKQTDRRTEKVRLTGRHTERLAKNITPENRTTLPAHRRCARYVLNVPAMRVLTKASSWAVIKGGGPALIGEACRAQELSPVAWGEG